jgi:vacuolar-type H+-ATPase subunit I/STV1
MNAFPANRTRLVLTACALLFELAHLGWEHLHGGVAAHHLMNRADLPAISNWWGALLIPALTWFLVGRILRRISDRAGVNSAKSPVPASILAGFLGALAYGAALALAFTMNSPAVSYVFLGLFAVSVLLRTYRAQYVLGFVLGMTLTFGAVLPTAIALVVASFAGLVHLLIGFVRRLLRNSRRTPPLPGAAL